MKRIRPKTYAIIFLLTIAFLIVVSKTFGQQTFPIGNKTSLNLSYGGYAADSAQRLPWRPSQFSFFDSTGRMYYNRYGDSSVYFHNGLRWVKLSTGGSSSGTVTSIAFGRGLLGGTITTSGSVSIDSTIIWTTRQVDSAIASFGFGHGTVTSVGTSTGLIGGTITASGTLQIDSSIVPKWDDTAVGNQKLITPAQLNARGYGTGTVTSVTAGTGLSGGVITTTGTISLPNAGTAGTYGSSSLIPVITTDAQGRVTAVTTSAVGGGTVTNVATGYGLSGGPITSTGTIIADTTKLIPFADTLSGNRKIATPAYINSLGYGSGTVTSVAAGTGLSGGTITTSGTISLPNTGTAGTFGSSTTSIAITTDAQGRVTAVTTSAMPQGTVTSVGLSAPTVFSVTATPITSSGTLGLAWTTGQTANQVLASPNGTTGPIALRSLVAGDIPALPYSSSTLANGNIFVGNGANTATSVTPNGDWTISNTGTATLKNTGTSGTYGTATSFPNITTDAQGRVTAVTVRTVTPTPTPSTPIAYDASSNVSGNNFIGGITTFSTAATTTTLTVTSGQEQSFFGTSSQTILLPVTSTLNRGHFFIINNTSTGAVTVNSSGNNLVATVLTGMGIIVKDTALTRSTTALDWEVGIAYPVDTLSSVNTVVRHGYKGTTNLTTITATGNTTGTVGALQILSTISITPVGSETIKVGTTSGASDVVASTAFSAGVTTTVAINKVFSRTASQTLFIQGAAGSVTYDLRIN